MYLMVCSHRVVFCCLQGRDKLSVKLAQTDGIVDMDEEDIEKVWSVATSYRVHVKVPLFKQLLSHLLLV